MSDNYNYKKVKILESVLSHNKLSNTNTCETTTLHLKNLKS